MVQPSQAEKPIVEKRPEPTKVEPVKQLEVQKPVKTY